MLRFGMPTLIETASIEECAALCSELELDFVEMNMNLPQYQVQTMDVQRLKSVARDYGIHYTIHLDENMNMADFNPLVAGAYRQTAIETIGLAKKLEIPVLNMHMPVGVYFTLPDRKVYLFGAYPEQFLDAMRQFRDECTAAIGGSGIRGVGVDGKVKAFRNLFQRRVSINAQGEELIFPVNKNHTAGFSHW